MHFVSMTDILRRAKEEKFAVGHFNLITSEFARTIVEVAEEEQAPVILGVGEPAIRYMGMDFLISNAERAAARAKVPVVLHLDHGGSFEIVMQCIRAGFSSVMFDGSKYPYEENVRLTKQVVEAAHAVGVSVEAELGAIGGVEDDHAVADEDAGLTDPDEAIAFWKETRPDALAINVGSAHGMYKREPNLRMDNIRKVAGAIDVPIVLHGGSGIPDAQIRAAIAAGVGKINVNTENVIAYTSAVRGYLSSHPEAFDPRAYQGFAHEAMKGVIREKIRLFGSNGKA